jgi:putative SOS response-associated peptidase YedK
MVAGNLGRDMCGRFVVSSPPQLLAAQFDVEDIVIEDRVADYNVTPRADVPIVLNRRDRRVLDSARWGLVPSWAHDAKIGDRLINARAETVMSSSAYGAAFRRRRCVIPADGFYEWWRRPGRPRQAVFLYPPTGRPLALAGLWEAWRDPSGGAETPWLISCSIVTTRANADVEAIHDRMPVVLGDHWTAWLDPGSGAAAVRELLEPAPAGTLGGHLVSSLVNQPANNGPELLASVGSLDDAIAEPDVRGQIHALTLFD